MGLEWSINDVGLTLVERVAGEQTYVLRMYIVRAV